MDMSKRFWLSDSKTCVSYRMPAENTNDGVERRRQTKAKQLCTRHWGDRGYKASGWTGSVRIHYLRCAHASLRRYTAVCYEINIMSSDDGGVSDYGGSYVRQLMLMISICEPNKCTITAQDQGSDSFDSFDCFTRHVTHSKYTAQQSFCINNR